MKEVRSWIRQQQSNLDQIIATAALKYYEDHVKQSNFEFDLNESIAEIGLLNSGGDLCYDRQSIGLAYSSWYQGKRISGMLDFFIQLLHESKEEEKIEIFDLGAGTGAVQWAISLVSMGMIEVGLSIPLIKIINIDSSPFMIQYNEDYLWQEFIKMYPQSTNFEIQNELISWTNPESSYEYNNVWLCASYLFDHTENENTIREVFKELTTKYRPQKVLLFGNWIKRHKVDLVADSLKDSYSSREGRALWSFLEGGMTQTQSFRDNLRDKGINFRGQVTWENKTWYGRILEPAQLELGINFPNELQLYQQPERNRISVKLTKEQRNASTLTKNPTIIIGPAGCGKSVVLTEKVKNIVEQLGQEYDKELCILLTTFNKDLVRYLGDWLEEILDPAKFQRTFDHWNNVPSAHSYFKFNGSEKYNITVMHFDVLPSKIGGLRTLNTQPLYKNYQNYHIDKIKKATKEVVSKNNIDSEKFAPILNEDFLMEEYHRVKYGMQCHTNKDYLEVSRIGRGAKPQLQKGKQRRSIVINIFREYKRLLSLEGCESYIIRRERFLKSLKNKNAAAGMFTHLLVDELQDCCTADYEIFYSLLNNPNNLTVAGDLAQSINIGASAQIPRGNDEAMKRFQKIYLEGSFRLPFRISECIRPLSESIKEKFEKSQNSDVYEIRPYKGAPPGARPIFMYQPDESKMISTINEIYDIYRVYDHKINKVDIMEKRNSFLSLLERSGINVEGHQVQKIKGMEKPFVIWDTLAGVKTIDEHEEFVYTILTRTTNVLVIIVPERLITNYFSIIRKFKKERILFWDEASKQVYDKICLREFEKSDEDEGHDEDLLGDIEAVEI